MDEEEVHIAIGKNFRKEKANILWAAANFPRATIVLVHVHWPSKWMPFMGGKLLYKFADEKEKEMHRGREMEAMVKMLLKYKSICDDTRKVVVLSRVKHPHIVKLIGVCPESCGLVYEHLPNGTLMDGLSKGLPWKDRIRILAEQRSALAHLHSSRPHAIIHADLKLTNILLDAGNVSRLGDFGTARVVQMKPLEEDTICRRTNPMGTMGYMDPVFFTTGELTAESDVYAFGVVILQVLTGLLDLNIVEQVQEAMKMDAAHGLLDASAGSWPEVQAERLMRLALRCCNLERKRRPAVTSDADWRSLDILRTMATASKSRKWSHAN